MEKRKGPKYSPFSKEFYIHYRGMNEVDALFEARSKRPFNKEYWMRKEGCNEEEAMKKVTELQGKNANKYAKKRKENPEEYNDKQPSQLGYWLKKGYSLEDAKQKQSNVQTTFSKEKCIERHGEIAGQRIWLNRQIKWQKSISSKTEEETLDINKRKGITLERLIEKYGVEDGKIKYSYWYKSVTEASKKRLLERGTSWLLASKSSLKVFLPFYDFVKASGIEDNDIYFGYEKHREFFLNEKGRFFSYDFSIRSRMFLVEFNGSCFHPRKEKLTEEEFENWKQLFSGVSADTIYKKDRLKQEIAEGSGYNVITLWEEDGAEYNIKKLITEFIKNEDRYKTTETEKLFISR